MTMLVVFWGLCSLLVVLMLAFGGTAHRRQIDREAADRRRAWAEINRAFASGIQEQDR